jgi:hypothetical protein
MSVTRVRRIFVTSGLMLYGGVAIVAIVVTLVERSKTFALLPLGVVSLPWSLMILESIEALGIKRADLPGGDVVWSIGICLTGVAINCFLFWLVVTWFFKLAEGRSRDRQATRAVSPEGSDILGLLTLSVLPLLLAVALFAGCFLTRGDFPAWTSLIGLGLAGLLFLVAGIKAMSQWSRSIIRRYAGSPLSRRGN